MSTVNLYDVLNVSQECDMKEIKNSYRKLAKEFHPDRSEGNAEMFELITHAYNILSNTKNRQEYDELFQLSKQSENDHFDLKQKSTNYFESKKTSKIQKSKEELENDFKKFFSEMDRKHNYKREYDKKLDITDLNRMMQDLQLAREQEDIESIHDQIFETGTFNDHKFNKVFDNIYKKDKSLSIYTGNPNPWNSIDSISSNFGSIENYSDLYLEKDNDNTIFESLKNDDSVQINKINKINKKEIDEMDLGENKKENKLNEEDFKKSISEKLKERELEIPQSYSDYNSDQNCGGYSIYDNLGVKNIATLTWDNETDIKAKYQKLLEQRNSTN